MENFLGEIRMFGGTFAPLGWAFCNGQLEAIADNEALFTLIGTTYGGDGQTNFALPDLRSRLPVGQGQGQGLTMRVVGQAAGTEQVTLQTANLPPHNHGFAVSSDVGNVSIPSATVVPAQPSSPSGSESFYSIPGTSAVNPVAMNPQSIGPAGGSQPHDNLMPALAVSFIIALQGIYPSRN